MAKILPFEEMIQCPPDNILRKVPVRPKNLDVRSREHLTLEEVNALMKAAGNIGRHQHRDKTLILIMFRHGLRVSEAVDLKWDQVDLKTGSIYISRLKNGTRYLMRRSRGTFRRIARMRLQITRLLECPGLVITLTRRLLRVARCSRV